MRHKQSNRRKLLCAAVCFALAACTAPTSQTGVTLHNGITLPAEWPPYLEQPTQFQAMTLPYLEAKPAVIPINVGRQLFVDDFLIDETNLGRVCHPATPYEGNPILAGDREWEQFANGASVAAPYSDGVWFDETDGKFKIWYRAACTRNGVDAFQTCYAESADGKHWTKAALDVVDGTNIVDTMHRNSRVTWLDKQEADIDKRYKALTVDMDRTVQAQYLLQYSSDGIHWGKPVAQSGRVQERSTAFYNPFTRKWVMSMRGYELETPTRNYSENENLVDAVEFAHDIYLGYNAYKRTPMSYWMSADEHDLHHPDSAYSALHPGIYNFDAIAYESIMLGQYTIFRGPHSITCAERQAKYLNEVCLGYSRDGFHFARPSHDAFIAADRSHDDAWNWGNVQSVVGCPIIVGDSLYFYVSGQQDKPCNPTEGLHDEVKYNNHSNWFNDLKMDSWTSTGLATLRRDGFVSMDAAENEGFLVTENVTFDGKYLFVNAKAKMLAVEVLDANGKVLRGYGREDCVALADVDGTKLQVAWNGHADLGKLAGKTVRFKFYLAKGSLYAFWVSPWPTGESRGYTGGGGNGLHPSGMDIPAK